MSPPLTKTRQGFTLVEMVVVIAVVGVIAAVVAVFLRGPVFGYIDTARRAELTDAADTALRRIGRDLRLALPNSVRVATDGTTTYLEFLLVRTGGRYRLESGSIANPCPGGLADDVLSFSSADSCFKTIGNIPNLGQVTANDFLVVFNLPTGTPNADAYQFVGTGGNKSQITAPIPPDSFAGEDRITVASHAFTFESPGRRFFIVEGPVTYACNPATGTLTRHAGYAIAAVQTAPPAPPPGGAGALLANRVTAPCTINYDTSAAQGAGLVTLRLTLSRDGETVTLYHAVHISNVP